MIRLATIGSNKITDKFLRALAAVPEITLDTVYSRTPARAEAYAHLHGAAHAVSDFSALVNNPAIDAVYIASPNLCHREQALALLRAKKHVLVEKPIAPSLAEYREMLACARTMGVCLMEAIRPAYSPGIAAVKACMAEIGTVRQATIQFCQYSSRYDNFRNGIIENAFRPELKNGALMDIGIYCVHVAQMLFGTPAVLHAAATFLPGSIDGQGSALLQYPDKTVSVIYSKITQSVLPSQIQGEDGAILLDAVSVPAEITVRPRKGEARVIRIPGLENDMDMVYELRAFVHQIQNGMDDAQIADILGTLQIADEIRAQSGIDFLVHP